MKIALIAPIHEPCPPRGYGGIELVVSLLADRLVAMGHRVALYATGDSRTTAELRWREPESTRVRRPLPRTEAALAESQAASVSAELLHVADAMRDAAEFDVIHNHAGYLGIAMAPLVRTPVVSTLHGPFTSGNRGFFQAMRDHSYVAISAAQREDGVALGLRIVGVVHNGVDTAEFASQADGEDLVGTGDRKRYLLFLGRISPEKGTHLAIAAALLAGIPLVIAGKVDMVDVPYWEARVQPMIDGERIRFVGEVTGRRKVALLQGATALLHPVQWPEPFGLVMAEAMAAGTPVVAYPRGAIPEIVQDGTTGFLAEDVPGMVEAIGKVGKLDQGRIREVAQARFDAGRMASDYVAVFERALAGSAV